MAENAGTLAALSAPLRITILSSEGLRRFAYLVVAEGTPECVAEASEHIRVAIRIRGHLISV